MDESAITIKPPIADAAQFAYDEICRLKASIRQRVEIEHIGSTAVDGLDAKPIVDLIVGAADAAAFAYVRQVLTVDLLYLEEGAGPHHAWLRWPATGPRWIHVHVVRHRGTTWNARVDFRDALRASASLQERYAALKRELAQRFPHDLSEYTRGKREFVDAVLASRGVRSEHESSAPAT